MSKLVIEMYNELLPPNKGEKLLQTLEQDHHYGEDCRGKEKLQKVEIK